MHSGARILLASQPPLTNTCCFEKRFTIELLPALSLMEKYREKGAFTSDVQFRLWLIPGAS